MGCAGRKTKLSSGVFLLKRTVLYNWHKSHGARMVEFTGWEMPLQYTTISEEHLGVREKAGLFDLSHMGRIRIRGKDRIPFMQYLFTNDLITISEGGIMYGFLCNSNGGIIDDITVYIIEDYLMLVVNACNTETIFNWLRSNANNFEVEIEDVSISLLMLAIQGPRAQDIMYGLSRIDLSNIQYHQFMIYHLVRSKAVISRTGYTGENGFEIYIGGVFFQSLWEQLLDIGAKMGLVPVGLGARDTLRIEACLPLYGHELTEETTPLEAGLDKFVKFAKNDFIGKKALYYSTNPEFARRLICFEMMDKAIPRNGHPVMFGDMIIGTVTSGTFSPTFQKGIGMAYVDQIKSQPDTQISILINENPHPAIIRKRPLYKRRSI